MSINLPNMAAGSAIAGLQSVGSVSNNIVVSGTINAGQYSTLTLSFPLTFPSDLNTNQVISFTRFQAPDNSGELPNYWYPIPGFLELYDYTNGYFIDVWVGGNSTGRTVNINLVNALNNSAISISDVTFNAVAELYVAPF